MAETRQQYFILESFRLPRNRRAKRTMRWTVVGAVAGSLTGIAIATIPTLASIFARTVVTPELQPTEDVRIFNVHLRQGEDFVGHIEIEATNQTDVSGTYSLVFANGRGVARIGKILSHNVRAQTITREIEEIYFGDITSATRGRWAGFIWPTPKEAGYDYTNVEVPVDNGLAPAWFVPAQHVTENDATWMITVHGRGSKRAEGLRMMDAASKLGMPSLLISYRNDGEAPDAPDKRYGLGTTEWPDVEAAILYALNHGAKSVVLAGYSMGGAVSLQLVHRSALSKYVQGLVLIGPVIDWVDVLRHQAQVHRLPFGAGQLGKWLISSRWGRSITGLATPVDLKSMDWVTRSNELKHPVLILHSEDDDFVPIGPSRTLAQRNPRFVSLVQFHRARHTRESNVDPRRFNAAVITWLHVLLNGKAHRIRSISAPAPQDD